MKLKFMGDGEVRIQEGLVLVLKPGDVINLPDEAAKRLMKNNPDFRSEEVPIKKIKTIKMEDKQW